MNDIKGENYFYTIIQKGDLVNYTVEVFNMSAYSGFLVEEEKSLGLVVSDLIESHIYGNMGGIVTLGHPVVESYDIPYFKIYCLKSSKIIYVPVDKLEIVDSS